MRYFYTMRSLYFKRNADRIDGKPRIGGFMCPSVSKYMNHFPALFLDSHLALCHLVNTKLSVSQTTKMAHSDAAVQKAS